MPSLDHTLGSVNPRNSLRRQMRAERVMERLPVELAGSVIGLRRQRLALERLFVDAQAAGDALAACRLSDSLVKVADAFQRILREPRRSRRSFPVYDLPGNLLESSIPDAEPIPDRAR